jgi:hypothetical protein
VNEQVEINLSQAAERHSITGEGEQQ